MSEWQPIETAPRDGSDVLVFGGTYSSECISCEFYGVAFNAVAIAWWDERSKTWNGGDLVTHNPTHWMPLPEPPK